LDAKLKEKGIGAAAELQQVLAQKVDVAREEAAIAEHREAMLSKQASLQTLQQAMGGAAYEQAAHENAKIAAAELQQQLEQSQAELTLGQDRLQQMARQLEHKAVLLERQQALQLRQENLRVLESLFKGAGFVQYVSTIYLKELVARADERFRRLSRNMLKLELDDDAEFQVRDMLNGGQLRSVKTLSGGQTFQASLCLALALADNMAARSGSRQNFFFLDEGFGTLDRESLAAVFDTLKELRNEQRVVGVISHVEELQQEIDTHLKVRQSEERGSWVEGSWE
jgi:exonuclease SbcC